MVIALAYPILFFSKPVSWIICTMNFVAPAGPPWVREYTRGYVLMIDTVDKTSTSRLVGFSRGSVMNRNCCHAPAPSIRAAS